MANWLKKYSAIPYADNKFRRILDFYLFQCPSEIKKYVKKTKTTTYLRVSNRGKTLRQRGWTGGYLNTLLAAMKNTASGQLTYRHFSSKTDILAEVQSIEKNTTLSDKNFEMIVMEERSDMALTDAIFYYIRNAFAHGSFSVNNKIYSFESAKDEKTKAVIRLREATLLQWIKDVSLSPNKLKELIAEQKKNAKKRKKVA